MRIFAGCDGGGSKCAVRVAKVDDNNEIVAEGVGAAGGANVNTDIESAIRNFGIALRAALAELGLPRDAALEHCVGAFAGATRVSHEKLISRMVSEHQIKRVSIVPDVSILFAAANVLPPALATIIGTGSIAWLQPEVGTTFRAGGEGPPDGDLGSGFWIGREAVRRELVPAKSDAELTPFEYARLAPDVFEMRNHEVATAILEEAASFIAEIVVNVLQQGALDAKALPWVCAGGVAVHQGEWLELVRAHCGERGFDLAPPTIVADPVIGALRMAIENATSTQS